MDKDELIKHGVTGCRLTTAEFLKTKIYDIFVIILIILYTLLIFIYFGLDGNVDESKYQTTLYIVEIIILGFFVLDITLHISSYCTLYLKDCWNIFDLIVIVLSILFVVLDFKVKNKIA
jgi:hypothetical protein